MKGPNRLKVLRAERGISQLDLAVKLGMGRDRYWHIENGYYEPTIAELRKLAKILRVDETALGFAIPESQATEVGRSEVA